MTVVVSSFDSTKIQYCLVEQLAPYVQASTSKKKGQDVPFFSQLLHQIMRQKPAL